MSVVLFGWGVVVGVCVWAGITEPQHRRLRRMEADQRYVRIVQVKNGAVLAERRDGSTLCAHCPFACLATCEPCEFQPPSAASSPVVDQ